MALSCPLSTLLVKTRAVFYRKTVFEQMFYEPDGDGM
jgi:hypothetical protein